MLSDDVAYEASSAIIGRWERWNDPLMQRNHLIDGLLTGIELMRRDPLAAVRLFHTYKAGNTEIGSEAFRQVEERVRKLDELWGNGAVVQERTAAGVSVWCAICQMPNPPNDHAHRTY